jgi:hypothetical protein
MDLPRPFVRLPWQFDAGRLAVEIDRLPASAWMAHPSRMEGNSALALVSRDGEDNDDFDGPMAPTPHLESCPYLFQALASFGEVLGRSRLMRLAPGAEVKLHVDFNYHWVSRVRIHVPVVTDPEVIFHCADQRVHMAPGECWLFNSWRRHRVTNDSPVERVHLVVDTAGSARFWRTVRQALATPLAAGDPAPEFVEFDPEGQPTLDTERFNTAPVMAPSELDALVAELVGEFAAHPGNDPALVDRYRELLDDLRHDWRAAWHRYGPSRTGWPVYRALLERVRAGLHRNPRALLTASNEIGVNPVIVQRILAPALAEDRWEDLVCAVCP